MPLLHLALVAIIQGITEFLPVSSSGHLILLPILMDMPDQGQVIDVAAHVGTLFAVIIYFWADVSLAARGVPAMLTGRISEPGARLAFLLLIATIPVIIAGFILKITGLSDSMRSMAVIGWTMLIFGLVLYWADQQSAERKVSGEWNVKDALVMGLWQAVALIPGTSRSGATITGARLLGYTRTDGAKLAMLMSIPTIIASGTLSALDLAGSETSGAFRDALIVAALSALMALAALSLMMRLLRSVSFTPYVIYRVILGTILLVVAYT
ncbi:MULTISPECIES: undecaprenyl-diphosphate phosphatase [Halocynthiibacter]|uniref:Undecaprenyl-diphosphatase n=1 Tax=Halocynthiibacter halioticoli TaxID=2986804 RepID=A0AAE3LPA0_9RHOB|nr:MULTISPECIES: undecaprenyl-diphosphate phosphatase [Halocynthiibacter]MCV6823122.1 undecaprenyl-diphosphate phosphatase [Halocynthiibacter halioticoli]MCW4056123.1 undecaprenyl-diphosphate phosphatase [Halocynthiibacter sp. SDUM655004]